MALAVADATAETVVDAIAATVADAMAGNAAVTVTEAIVTEVIVTEAIVTEATVDAIVAVGQTETDVDRPHAKATRVAATPSGGRPHRSTTRSTT